jgi:hypothetical protein
MTACSVEEQTNFWIYNLETACKMADDAGEKLLALFGL